MDSDNVKSIITNITRTTINVIITIFKWLWYITESIFKGFYKSFDDQFKKDNKRNSK